MLYTCEQVSNGHPDKLCDQISDAILTDCLVHDPMTRAGIECLIKNDQIVIAGEITSKHDPDYELAKDIIRAGWAHRCEVQLAYAIGIAEPVSIRVDTFNTGVNDAHLVEEIRKKYDLTPQGIITELDLRNVDYNRVSAYGHFTDQTLPWEV